MHRIDDRYRRRYFDPQRNPLPRRTPLLEVLRSMDAARAQLRVAEQDLQHVLHDLILEGWDEEDDEDLDWGEEAQQQRSTELHTLRTAWDAFRGAGGATAHDLERWLNGENLDRINKKTTRSKRHLRIVSNRTPRVRLRLDPPPRGGDEAA